MCEVYRMMFFASAYHKAVLSASQNVVLRVGVGPLYRSVSGRVGRCLRCDNQKMEMSTVDDKKVNVTFIQLDGSRVTVPGLVGQNLVEVAAAHDIVLHNLCGGGGDPIGKKRSSRWMETLFGAGPSCNSCMVILRKQYYDMLPRPFEKEVRLMEDCQEDYVTGSSRLGCQVVLTKEMDGIQILLPESELTGP